MAQILRSPPNRSGMTFTQPHSIEAEQQLLGAVLVNNELFHKVGSMLETRHFYDPVHADIWAAISDGIGRDELVSPVTLRLMFEDHAGMKELGGPAYLVRMAGASMSSFAVVDYAKVIIDRFERRALLETISEVTDDVQSGKEMGPAVAALEIALAKREAESQEPRAMSFLKAETLMLQQMIRLREDGVVGAPSGLAGLDESLTLSPKRYTIIGGATSMGKTALAIWLMYQAASAGFGVAYWSLEMPEEDIAKRLNSIHSQIPYKAFDRKMSDTLMAKVVESVNAMERMPIQILSDRVKTVPALIAECKRIQTLMVPSGDFQGLKLVVVDYIQLVKGKGESALVRLSEVANELKHVAKQLDVHIIALAQVDRSLGKRDDTRPTMADLRGSGDLEMAPDNVVLVHRPEYYLSRQQPPKKPEERADWEAELSAARGKMEIIMAKSRMGKISSVTVNCDMSTNRFWEEAKVGTDEMVF